MTEERGYNFKTVELRDGDSSFSLPEGFQFIGFSPTMPLRAVFVERVATEDEQAILDINKDIADFIGPAQLGEARMQLEMLKQAKEQAANEAETEAIDAEVVEGEHPSQEDGEPVEWAVESARVEEETDDAS